MTSAEVTQGMLAAALEAWDAGLAPIPVRMDFTKRPALEKWNGRTHERFARAEVERLFAEPRALAIVCGAASGGLEMLEVEDVVVQEGNWQRLFDSWPEELRQRVCGGYLEFSPSGGIHVAYRVEGMDVPGNTKLARRPRPDLAPSACDTLIETRGWGGYFVAAPSPGEAHESGNAWELHSGGFGSIATITAEEREVLVGAARVFDEMPPEPERAERKLSTKTGQGRRPGEDYDARHTCGEVLERNGWTVVRRRGDEVMWCRPGKSAREGHSGIEHLDEPNRFVNWSSSTTLEVEQGYSAFALCAHLEHGGDFSAAARELGKAGYGEQTRREAPGGASQSTEEPNTAAVPETPAHLAAALEPIVIGHLELEQGSPNGHRPEQAWPELDEAAYRGLAGEVVRTLEPHTEADPAGMLLSFLAQFGCVVGPSAHIRLSGKPHAARLYGVLVGDSASRKGACDSMPRWLMSLAFPSLVGDRFTMGLSTSEGLIDQVVDEELDSDGKMVRPGVADKRLYVFEDEFTVVLERMRRQGNTLSQTLRSFWDDGNARTMTTTNPRKATGAHVVVMGDATPEELAAKLARTDVTNGFANRFLFAVVRRHGELPFGGSLEDQDLRPLATRLQAVSAVARSVHRVEFGADARKLWPEVYRQMRQGIPEGPIGHYLARADIHVLRLALVYALLDGAWEIGWEHIEAGMALWAYCRASVAMLLERAESPATGTDEDMAELVELLLKHPGGLKTREARALLGWNGSRLVATRARAERFRLLETEAVRGPDGGRPAVVLRARGD